jgi:hypothetical protein
MSGAGPLQTSFNRYRYGDTKPVVSLDIVSATVIEIGDMVFQDDSDSDNYKPASDIGAIPGTHATLALAQEAFHDEFVGVSLSRSKDGDTNHVRIATEGVFEFDCASATFKAGQYVGPDDNAGGTALESQQVIAVADATKAIGQVEKDYTSATTSVLVRIKGVVHSGGVQSVIT